MDAPLAGAGATVALAAESEGDIVVGCLWFLVIALMFYAQHHVCDSYFVPAINCFVHTMKSSKMKCANRWGEEAVAGATICALGCNGPELFSNLISLYQCSDAGIGVVVGSEIFNVLVIIGCATLAAAGGIVFERTPFARDCTFYALSIVLLYRTMQDRYVDLHETATMLVAAAAYVASVYFTTDVVNALPCLRPQADTAEGAEVAQEGSIADDELALIHGVRVQVKEVVHGRLGRGSATAASAVHLHPREGGIKVLGAADSASSISGTISSGPMRFAAASIAEQRASVEPQMPDSVKDSLMGGSILRYDNLHSVKIVGEGHLRFSFHDGVVHQATLLIDCACKEDQDRLVDLIKQQDRGVRIVEYDATALSAVADLVHHLTDKDTKPLGKLLAFPEFLVDFVLKGTLFAVDVKDVRKESRWPLCFAGAMFWLAVFSFLMLNVADQIHSNMPFLPTSFLGITVCAIGTSFPNAVASIIMAKQGKPAAAIANALGSNVQNVFLAMALPWMIFLCVPGTDCKAYHATGEVRSTKQFAPIFQDVGGLNEGILWMAGTLAIVVLFVVMPGFCRLEKQYGFALLALYASYLALSSAETFLHFTLLPASG